VDISAEVINLIDEIRNDRVHGASYLARQAAEVIKIATEHSQVGTPEEFLVEQKEIGRRLMSARPAMAPVSNVVSRLLNTIAAKSKGMDLESISKLTASVADEIIKDSQRATVQIAQYGTQLINDGDTIMTHSYSATVMAVLKKAFSRHGNIEVTVTRSGSGRTGEIIAQELGPCGIPITFIDDAAMGLYVSTVNKVMVGADRVCADGKIVNGIGTYQLALASKQANIPFYVVCDTLKFDPRLRGNEVDLEEKEPSEVVEPTRLPPGVRIRNPYFDITPPELVSGIVTENGLFTAEEVIAYLKGQSAEQV